MIYLGKGWFVSKKDGFSQKRIVSQRQAESHVLCRDQGTSFPLDQGRVASPALLQCLDPGGTGMLEQQNPPPPAPTVPCEICAGKFALRLLKLQGAGGRCCTCQLSTPLAELIKPEDFRLQNAIF